MSQWIIIGLAVIICPLLHFFMMRKSHKHSDNEQAVSNENDKNKDDKNDKNHSGHGCCH